MPLMKPNRIPVKSQSPQIRIPIHRSGQTCPTKSACQSSSWTKIWPHQSEKYILQKKGGGSIHLARLKEWIPIFILMTTSHHTKKTNLVFRIWEIHSSGQTCRVKSACQSSSWRKISSKIQLLFKIGLLQEFILIELPYFSTTRPVKRLAILAQDGSTKAIWDGYRTEGYKWMGLGLGRKSPGGAMLRAPSVLTIKFHK